MLAQATTNNNVNTVIDINSNSNINVYSQKKLSEEKKNKLLAEIRKNKSRWYDSFGSNLQTFRDDKFFYMGQSQWDTVSSNSYSMLGKIPYTFNLIKPIVRQLQGEMAQMQPSITLTAFNLADVDAQLLILMTDFIRAEIYHSNAQIAYVNCFLNQCIGGWGVLEISTEYESQMLFDQVIRISGEGDPLMIGFDPTAKAKSKSDGAFQFKDYFMDKEDFRAQFNREPPANAQMLGTQRQFLPIIDENTVIITDYYKKEFKSKTLIQLTDYDSYKVEVLEADLEPAQKHYVETMLMAGKNIDDIRPLVISNRRKTTIETIHCYKCVCDDVLEHKIWPAKYFPFVFVDGASSYQDGAQFTESFINCAKDAQKSYNYTMSEIYNGIPRARREQVWMTRTQAQGHEEFMRYPDRQQSHAEYNIDPLAPPPIFRPPEELPQSLFNAASLAKQAVYDCLGLQPRQGNDIEQNLSGLAVGRIITQSNLTFVQIINNLFDGMECIGKIALDLIPKVYDSERVITAVDATGRSRAETINTVENGQEKYNLSSVLCKLEVKAQASFAIQQADLRNDLYNLCKVNPQNSILISDLIAATLETPIAPMLSQRLQTLVPPPVLAKETGAPPPPPPPPSPQQQLEAAQVKKVQAETLLAVSQAHATQAGLGHKQQQLQQDSANSVLQYQLNTEKLQASRDETIAATHKAYVDSATEIQKAQLDHDAKLAGVMAQIAKAGSDASKQF